MTIFIMLAGHPSYSPAVEALAIDLMAALRGRRA